MRKTRGVLPRKTRTKARSGSASSFLHPGSLPAEVGVNNSSTMHMKILLVDDEKSFLETMGEALEAHGFEVVRAEDGKQAREALEMEQIDVILSDVLMPTLDGERFHSYVRDLSSASDVPFIFLTGYDDESVRKLIVDPARDFYFSKTTPLETILACIENLQRQKKNGGS